MATKKIQRSGGRKVSDLRPLEVVRGYTKYAPGSVLISMGDTKVLCTACVDEGVPEWMEGQGRGWVTAEYDMLPSSTSPRRKGSRKRQDGRSTEIQRLIGRVLRAIVNFELLGERTVWLDCDVLQADGGTRTAAINGAYIALSDAVRHLRAQRLVNKSPIVEPVGAVSVGKIDGRILVDLDYAEDSRAEVDCNLAMTKSGRFVEIQGSAEGATFDQAELDMMLKAGQAGIRKLIAAQRRVLAEPLD